MNPTPAISPKSLQISTPTDTTIVLVRAFDAPRRLVWEAMFTPDKMRRWMLPPPGWTLTTCHCEPRVGGALDVAWKSDEADPATNEPGRLQHADVLGGRGEGHSERCRELAEVALPARELPDDRAPSGVGQGVKNDVEPGRAI